MATVTKIDRFRIIKEIGKDLCNIAFLAEDTRTNRRVVIKMLDLHLVEKSGPGAELPEAARAARSLRHPNIVTVHEIGEYEKKPYFVFEYMDGITLKDLIEKEGPLPMHRALNLMSRILAGACYANERGVTHPGLVSSRIIVDTADAPRIMDYGISIVAGARMDPPGAQACMDSSGAPHGLQSDILSLGLVFYELLTGGSPGSLADICKIEIEPPSRRNKDVDEMLDKLVLKAFGRTKEARYSDVREMKLALDAHIAAGCGAVEPDRGFQPPPDSTLEILLRKMQLAKDFPAFSRHILEINQKASASSANLTSPAQLAGVILKDFSLTNKLLKLVNSAFYGNFAGSITTISKAVMVLGFKQVSLAASSLMLFDHLQNKTQSDELKDAAVSSFMSGLVARDLAGKMGAKSLEESFICAMLNNLGRYLVIYYLPDESHAIKSMIARKGESERTASRSVLGMHYEEIGMAVLKAWNFPSKIVGSLIRLPEGKIDKPGSDEEILQCLSGYSNELCDVIRSSRGNDRILALKALSSRFQKVVAVSETQLSKMLNTAKEQMEAFSDVLDIDIGKCEFLKRLSMDSESETDKGAGQSADRSAGQSTDLSAGVKHAKAVDSGNLHQDKTARSQEAHLDVLISGIQEITNALLSDYRLNDMMFMILETMYRGFEFNHVIFCMMEMNRTGMLARHAFGADIEGVTEKFGFKISNVPTDIFNMALSQQRDIIVEDAKAPNIIRLIPAWYQQAFSAPAFVIYPIIIKDTPFGLFYADKKQKGVILSPVQLNYMKTLRNQSILAIKQKL